MDTGQLILDPPPPPPAEPVEPARLSGAPAVGRPDGEGFVGRGSAEMYRIARADDLQPFLMSVVSAGDLWMYVSSRGGLAAGRRGPDQSLFGYETDDRLHHLHGITGPFTLVRPVLPAGRADLPWEPFSPVADPESVTRNLYKSVIGNSVVFEEEHHGLGLAFRYRWQNCDAYGFVRTATIVNRSPNEAREVDVLDGLLNLLPAGVTLGLQQASSCLVDAYKVAEVDRPARLAIYSLASLVSDRAEPAESLRASVAWSRGLANYRVLLSDRQAPAFRRGRSVQEETRLRGYRNAFLVSSRLHLRPGQAVSWDIVADVARSQGQVAALRRFLIDEPHPSRAVQDQVEADSNALVRMVASHDGLQSSADRKIAVHHFANVLFNTMRGGAFADQGTIGREDFRHFVSAWSRPAAERHGRLLDDLPATMSRAGLLRAAESAGDATLTRLALEFLPLTFGRRHGDPSRPWNKFEIRVSDDAGRRILAYQGNWRDIFQNWEALCLSYPAYTGSFVAKFVNASTIDGFNPYRLSHDGIEWECPEPHNPWANIGYWGDHQIVYLTRLLELSRRYNPEELPGMLALRVFTYADVPYRLKPYESLLRDCRDTIEFDATRDAATRARAAERGADGRLLCAADGEVLHVTLAEKLLVPVLAKLSNFVPGGGIWMNTQRPEWNDANNALAGHGLSVVTLCHLRRHLALLEQLFAGGEGGAALAMSQRVAAWLRGLAAAFGRGPVAADDDRGRKQMMDVLGGAFGAYRAEAYESGPGGSADVERGEVVRLLRDALRHVDGSIRSNRRGDGLYHAYNLLALSTDGSAAGIERLPEMLEGQVAVLSSGVLDDAEALAVIDALFASALYAPAAGSFLLYPDRPTAGFLEKNVIPPAAVEEAGLLTALISSGDARLVTRDVDGAARFAPGLRNIADLHRVLDALASDPTWAARVAADRDRVAAAYERVFRHHSFTGRSGAMAGYEGLGCVYWHMVAKLLVAVQECHDRAATAGASADVLERFAQAYERVRGGLGFNKSARDYGAFPTDPYSHTPSQGGARQPGMTGQVKEEIITRFGELGVRVEAGALRFAPRLLCADEFSTAPGRFEYVAPDGSTKAIDLPAGSLAFTLCQAPVVYRAEAGEPRILVVRPGNVIEVIPGDTLPAAVARQVFERRGEIVRLEVIVPKDSLRARPQDLPRFQADRPGTPSAVPAGGNGRRENVPS